MPSRTKSLLTVSALAELGAGASLLLAPSLTVELLAGAGLGSATSLLVARVAGVALLSIGLICWVERTRNVTAPPVGLVVGLAIYNAAVAALLADAALVDGMNGLGLWPTIGLHVVLTIWCAASLRAA